MNDVRDKLEPDIKQFTSVNFDTISLMSIAISLKRIADGLSVLPRMNMPVLSKEDEEELTRNMNQAGFIVNKE